MCGNAKGPGPVRGQGLRGEVVLVVDGFRVHKFEGGEACFHFGLLAEVFQGGELGLEG